MKYVKAFLWIVLLGTLGALAGKEQHRSRVIQQVWP